MPFATIPSGTTGFLIVAFDTLWDIMVDDKAHIGLIDAHTKGNGGHDHIHLFHQEHILILGTCFGIEPGMIGYSTHSIHLEYLGEFLDPFSAQTIDDSRLSLVLFYKTDDVRIHILGFGTHFVEQIGPVKRCLKHLGIRHP